MRNEIQETRRELARLNAELARLGQNGGQNGRTFGQKFKSAALAGLKEAAKGAAWTVGENLARRMLGAGESGGRSYGKGFKRAAKKELDTLSASPAAAGLRMNIGALPVIGAGVLAAGIASQVAASLGRAFEQERLQISFDALSADGGGGSRIFERLRGEALRTGQEISGMAATIQRFMGLGFAEDDAMKLNASLLDIAGALGMSNSEASLLGTALAQVKAKGVASMEELRQQIAEKGVPVFELLAQKIGVTEGELIQMVSSGKVGADTVIEAFMNMEGPLERFRGGAERTASTAGGMFERLKRAIEDLKMRFGEAMLPNLKPLLEDAIGFVVRMKEEAAAFGEALGNAIGYARAMFQTLSFGEMFQLAALKLKEGILAAMDAGQRAAAALIEVMGEEDTFGRMMERAALKFREIMLETAALLLKEMGEVLPKGMIHQAKLANAVNFLRADADLASAKREALEAEGVPGLKQLARRFQEAFDRAPSRFNLSEEEAAQERRYQERIAAQRAKTLQAPAVPTAASSGGGLSGGAMAAAAGSAGGLLAGGLANALSRISGGPSTLLMTRQLETMKGVHAAVRENVAATGAVATAVDRLTRKVAVFS